MSHVYLLLRRIVLIKASYLVAHKLFTREKELTQHAMFSV